MENRPYVWNMRPLGTHKGLPQDTPSCAGSRIFLLPVKSNGFANRNHLSPILARGPQPRMPPLYQRTATLYYKWETRSHADDPRAEPLPAWRDAPRVEVVS